jgi:hypothetical protein
MPRRLLELDGAEIVLFSGKKRSELASVMM